jgi:hypothetical protein
VPSALAEQPDVSLPSEWEGIEQLPHLRVLHLDCAGLTQQRLMLLTRLSSLHELTIHVNEEVTDAVVGTFQMAISAATGRVWQRLQRSLSGRWSVGCSTPLSDRRLVMVD